MGYNIRKEDVAHLLESNGFLDSIVKQMTTDSKMSEKLAHEVADELADYLEDDPSFQQKILKSAMKNADFKKNILEQLIKEIS